MKRLLRFWPVALAVLLLASPAMASVVSSALYNGKIRVTNSSNSTVTATAVNLTLNSGDFIDNCYCNSTMTDIAIQINGADTAFMPGYDDAEWYVYVSSIDAIQNVDYDLYSSNATGGDIVYIPGSSGMIVSDAPNMELKDSFEWDVKGIPILITANAASDNFVKKDGSYLLWNSADYSVTSYIYGSSNCTVSGLFPNTVYRIVSAYDGVDHTLVVYDDDDSQVDSDTDAWSGNATDNSNDWIIGEKLLYMEYIKLEAAE